ncbi:flavonoid 3'-monooxygenase CYP75B137 [Lactuca sativa]|uniref:Cytochrome P450 n=1 Tax=Lactuca sativa TaxID=4236 RepID=A0A9R1WW47_LACSA|nr:flavonoid 3'-monooxygenase CYP75B137 [Lactuca sativa]KAJ0189846.1 hypothetical protein LSAT_V11C800422170 [Lactuca sativa]
MHMPIIHNQVILLSCDHTLAIARMISELGIAIYLTMTNFWLWWWEVDSKQDEFARTFLTLLVPTLLLLWYQWTFPNSKKGKSANQLPPGPYGFPVLGYLPFLGSNLHEKFTEMGHRYGPIFSLRLGTKLHVVVNSMELAKVVARDQDKTLANRSPPLTAVISSYGVNNISWSNNNAHWRNMRKLLVSQLMSTANINTTQSQSLRTHEVRKMVADVYAKLGQQIDINEIGFNAAFDVLTRMLWSGSKPGEGNFTSYLVERFLEVEFKIIELQGARNISDFLPMLSWLDLQGRQREMKQQMVYVNQILDELIQGRIKANSCKVDGEGEEDQKDFLQILLELKEQKGAPTSYNFDQIKALLMNIVTAATVTISIMVEWAMAEILHNAAVKKKIVEELTEVVGTNNIVEESHLTKLSYLDAAIKETLRLHPPLPLLVHRCPDEACIVGGYTIPKGTVVYLNVWAIHRDPQNWSNPLEFKPERFLNGKWDYSGNNFKYLPFGSGRRMCPGVNLGEKMLMYTVASLLHSFEWSFPEGEELELSDEYGFLTKKRKPLMVIPSQKLSDASMYM